MRCAVDQFQKIILLFLLAVPSAHAELILSSAPRESREKEESIYKPVADLLSRASGQKVSFRYADNFLVYQDKMRKGAYDIVLDGPTFVAWRMARLGHVPVVKFPGNLSFVVVVQASNEKIKTLKDLTGRTLCGFAPPNLATMTILYEFGNPSRQPLIIEAQSFKEAYQGLAQGKCAGAIMQGKIFADLDKETRLGKVIFQSNPLPNQAISAGPRVTPEMRAKMVTALLAPENALATQKMREFFRSTALLPASAEEYRGLEKLMRDVWGFD